MRKRTCDVCKRKTDAATLTIHNIIPKEIVLQSAIPPSETAILCKNCRDRVSIWYFNRVSTMTYDWGLRRFRSRSAVEMVREYEAAYAAFAKYERWCQHIAKD